MAEATVSKVKPEEDGHPWPCVSLTHRAKEQLHNVVSLVFAKTNWHSSHHCSFTVRTLRANYRWNLTVTSLNEEQAERHTHTVYSMVHWDLLYVHKLSCSNVVFYLLSLLWHVEGRRVYSIFCHSKYFAVFKHTVHALPTAGISFKSFTSWKSEIWKFVFFVP